METWLTILLAALSLGLLLYWQLVMAEGAYLGAPLVAFLYDLTAERYNRIKDFDPDMETHTLGLPLANRLYRCPNALALDVATGTGRLPLALFNQPGYKGRVIGLDRAAKMLTVARRQAADWPGRLSLVQADAAALPFAGNSVPVVTCLEALEFTPNPHRSLLEIVRVLKPASPPEPDGGWLVFTNRIGWEAQLMPGKTWSRAKLASLLQTFPLAHVDMLVWQTIYDLVWAQKVAQN
jgi:ubiquinone/menaquinone biosynthesis C-methylase UbiE